MSDQETGPVRTPETGSITFWGVDPDGATEWVKAVLIALLFTLPFAILVLILWRLVLNYLPGFDWSLIYPVILLVLVGVAVYRRHRSDERNGLRVALLAELKGADGRTDFTPSRPVFEASIDRLHLLTEAEIRALVEYGVTAERPDPDAEAVDSARDRAISAIEVQLDDSIETGIGE